MTQRDLTGERDCGGLAIKGKLGGEGFMEEGIFEYLIGGGDPDIYGGRASSEVSTSGTHVSGEGGWSVIQRPLGSGRGDKDVGTGQGPPDGSGFWWGWGDWHALEDFLSFF